MSPIYSANLSIISLPSTFAFSRDVPVLISFYRSRPTLHSPVHPAIVALNHLSAMHIYRPCAASVIHCAMIQSYRADMLELCLPVDWIMISLSLIRKSVPSDGRLFVERSARISTIARKWLIFHHPIYPPLTIRINSRVFRTRPPPRITLINL